MAGVHPGHVPRACPVADSVATALCPHPESQNPVRTVQKPVVAVTGARKIAPASVLPARLVRPRARRKRKPVETPARNRATEKQEPAQTLARNHGRERQVAGQMLIRSRVPGRRELAIEADRATAGLEKPTPVEKETQNGVLPGRWADKQKGAAGSSLAAATPAPSGRVPAPDRAPRTYLLSSRMARSDHARALSKGAKE